MNRPNRRRIASSCSSTNACSDAVQLTLAAGPAGQFVARPRVSRTVQRVPSASITSSDRTLSAVVPHATEWAPQALLAIMPPSVARLAEDGSAPNASPCGRAAASRSVSTRPGSMTAVRASSSMSRMRFTCRDASMTTPPMALPAIDVPPPRIVTGAPAAAVSATAAAKSSASAGTTTMSGTHAVVRSVAAYSPRLAASSPTDPRSADRSVRTELARVVRRAG